VTFGFIEGIFNEARLIGQSGARCGLGGILNMFSEHDMGYFFVLNAERNQTSACRILPEFRQQFERFLRQSASGQRHGPIPEKAT
jgi:hypothetical protein